MTQRIDALDDDLTPAAACLDRGLTLDEWMAAESLKDQAVADMMGKDKATVWRVRTGKAKATFDFIEKAIEVSGGRIDGNSFFRRALSRAAVAPPGGGAPRPFNSTSSTDPSPPPTGSPEWPLP